MCGLTPVTGHRESGKGRTKLQKGMHIMADHSHGNVAEHKVGSMDIRAQEKTFAAFIRFTIWGAVLTVLVLIFLALSNA
jgi:hypothetical protein